MKASKKPINFVLLGPQGCGKGTQARLLLNKFKDLYYIYTGDLYRDLIGKDSDAAKRIKRVVESGDLVMESVTLSLWINKIIYNIKSNQGILLDGSPRRLKEAEDFVELFRFLERDKNTIVFVINISKQESFDRLTKRRVCKKCKQVIPWIGKYKELKKCDKCGGELFRRQDDDIDGIKLRLKRYRQWTIPAINYIKNKNMKVVEINGEQPIEKVFKDILKNI